MCGLVGIVGANLSTLHLEAFKWMLHLDTVRGEDSTGIALRKSFVGKKNRSQVIVAKTEGHPSNLTRKFPELFDHRGMLHNKLTERFDFLMGHNRAATIGAVNATNAHPFHHGSITGCHNGTISGGLLVLPTGEAISGHTDSEKLIFALSKGWSIKKIMDTVTGAAAMTWWDSEKKTFNIYRNKERSLFLTHNDTKTVYAYASEEWILRVALVKGKLSELVKNIKEFPVNEHVEIVLGDNKIEEVKVNSVAPLVVKPTNSSYGDRSTGVVTTFANKHVKLLNHKKPNWASEVNKSKEPFRPASGWLDRSYITKEEFDKDARDGCAMCQTDLEYEDHVEGFVKWMDRETPICLACSKEWKHAS
jgi:asparagine synthetase B (glutamine-hydrolysing)